MRAGTLPPPADDSVLVTELAVEPDLAPMRELVSERPVKQATASWDIVDEWGTQSFPASDPPANW